MRIIYAVTGHGFGHATRAATLVEELRLRRPAARIEVWTDAPARLFRGCAVKPGLPDPGMIQKGPLDVDWPASLAAHLAAAERWEKHDKAAATADMRGAALVLSDAPAFACEAAAAAGVPSYLVTNFTWDAIVRSAPRGGQALADRLGSGYGAATGAFRLPGACGFGPVDGVVDAPLLARRSVLDRPQARAALGVPEDGRRLLLVSFGGFGSELRLRCGGGWDGWRLMGFGEAPEGLDAPWHRLDDRPSRPHAEAVAAADAILCKPGYGTFAEAAAHATRALYVQRPGYPEAEALAAWLAAAASAEELPRAELEAGAWRPALERLMARPARPPVPADGAVWIADRLLGAA